MIISIENCNGETIGAIEILEQSHEDDDGIYFGRIMGEVSIADVDYDDIFDTDDMKVRIQLECRRTEL